MGSDPTTGATDPEDLAQRGAPSDGDSLVDVLRAMKASGFGGSFRPADEPVEGRAAVICSSCRQASPAADLHVAEERRLEGASDPDDMVLALAGRCPACGAGGVIVLGYGPGSSVEDADVLSAIEDHTGDDPASHPAGGRVQEGDGPPVASGLGRAAIALDRLEGLEGLDRLADPAKRTIERVVPERALGILQGRWLGHRAHPLLTDLPIGCWTSAWLLDLFGGERAEPAADALVALGVVTVVPTAWTGWSDWIDLPRDKRRTGVVHAAANGAAAALYSASFVARRRGDRRLGIRLGHAGAAVATVGGFLGGHLAFGD